MKLEDRLVDIVRRHPGLTANEISHYVYGLGSLEAAETLRDLVYAGRLECYVQARSLRYQLPTPFDVPESS